jgi:hypothetical protein
MLLQVWSAYAKIAIASIEKVLAGPSAADYFGSAQYFLQSNGDITKLEHISIKLWS